MEEKKDFVNVNLPGIKSDPSDLTTALILREVGSLRELFLTHIERIDKAVEVAHSDSVRFPTVVQEAVSNLKELHEERFASLERRFLIMDHLQNEKFAGIQKQIDMQDKLSTQQYNFLVQSNDKSDSSLVKIIDQQALLIMNKAKSADDKYDDLKDRFSKVENLLTASLSAGTGRHESIKNVGANIGTIISIITLIIVLISFALKFSGKSP